MNPLIIKKLNINKPEKAKAKILFYISRNLFSLSSYLRCDEN